jgi:hypothetical protein
MARKTVTTFTSDITDAEIVESEYVVVTITDKSASEVYTLDANKSEVTALIEKAGASQKVRGRKPATDTPATDAPATDAAPAPDAAPDATPAPDTAPDAAPAPVAPAPPLPTDKPGKAGKAA